MLLLISICVGWFCICAGSVCGRLVLLCFGSSIARQIFWIRSGCHCNRRDSFFTFSSYRQPDIPAVCFYIYNNITAVYGHFFTRKRADIFRRVSCAQCQYVVAVIVIYRDNYGLSVIVSGICILAVGQYQFLIVTIRKRRGMLAYLTKRGDQLCVRIICNCFCIIRKLKHRAQRVI